MAQSTLLCEKLWQGLREVFLSSSIISVNALLIFAGIEKSLEDQGKDDLYLPYTLFAVVDSRAHVVHCPWIQDKGRNLL